MLLDQMCCQLKRHRDHALRGGLYVATARSSMLTAVAFLMACSSPGGGKLDTYDPPDERIMTDFLSDGTVGDVPFDAIRDAVTAPDGFDTQIDGDVVDAGTTDIGLDSGDDVLDASNGGDISATQDDGVETDAGEVETCCSADSNCRSLGDGYQCVGQHSSVTEKSKVCRPQVTQGLCWDEDDCDKGLSCHGVHINICGFDGATSDTGPGLCRLPGDGECNAIDPGLITRNVVTDSLVVWNGTQCVQTESGYSGCEPFCDLTFESIADCNATCPGLQCGGVGELQAGWTLTGTVPNLKEIGELTLLEDGLTGAIEAGDFYPGYTGRWTFHLESGDLTLSHILPEGTEPPFEENQQVRIFLKIRTLDTPAPVSPFVLVAWDSESNLLFMFENIITFDKWFDCGGESPCPSVDVLKASCEPETLLCGFGYRPPVRISLNGDTDSGVTLREGERTVADGHEYGAVMTRKYQYVCSDVFPERLITYIIANPGSANAEPVP